MLVYKMPVSASEITSLLADPENCASIVSGVQIVTDNSKILISDRVNEGVNNDSTLVINEMQPGWLFWAKDLETLLRGMKKSRSKIATSSSDQLRTTLNRYGEEVSTVKFIKDVWKAKAMNTGFGERLVEATRANIANRGVFICVMTGKPLSGVKGGISGTADGGLGSAKVIRQGLGMAGATAAGNADIKVMGSSAPLAALAALYMGG